MINVQGGSLGGFQPWKWGSGHTFTKNSNFMLIALQLKLYSINICLTDKDNSDGNKYETNVYSWISAGLDSAYISHAINKTEMVMPIQQFNYVKNASFGNFYFVKHYRRKWAKFYKLDKFSWNDAVKVCQTKVSHLPKFFSRREQEELLWI